MRSALFTILLLFSLASISAADPGFTSPPARGEAEPGPAQVNPPGGESRGNVALLCRKACDLCESARSKRDAGERSAEFRRAEELARQAIEADPQSDEGYKWLAITLGAQVEDADVAAQIELSRRIKDNIEKALSLDPDDDMSLLVLSRWHYKVASLEPWTRTMVKLVYGDLPHASLEQAEDLLLRAIAKHDRIAHRYSLAKVYHRMGRREAALDQLRLALALPVTFAEEAGDVEKARKKLDRWK